ncbi:SDR family oxidoreductase [Acaryochloris sp. IP29b_bin.137]|uniref:NAD-dependent epimerase/dehydratase family protein n=1 Tax=Acaryochloris sp. IP29b_bin.137 TaxID=2969217 RepID=UPI00261ED677|nr:SDR family oxidoreductase [Acaryochloris sp. IP29b_bin.137]
MSRILVTGGLGFVGGRVAAALAAIPEYEVVVSTRSEKIAQVDWLPNAQVVSCDLMSDDDCHRVCQDVETVIHLAALNEIESGQNPQQALLVTGLGSLKLLEAAQNAGVHGFIYFSTAHVYGAPLVGVINESVIPRPAHPYAIAHKTAEDFILAAGDRSMIETLVVRLSNAFGAPTHSEVNRWTLVVNDLCRQAVTARTLSLRSSGLEQRDFIALDDVGRAIIHFLRPEVDWDDGIFNLGGENSLRIIDIAKMIQARCESVFGFKPGIQRPEPSTGEKSDPLTYEIVKLKATGFELRRRITQEIDATLMLCQTAFGCQ